MTRPLPLPLTLRGTGHYAPEAILTNDFFAGYLDTSDEWITSRTGIRTRHRAAPEVSRGSNFRPTEPSICSGPLIDPQASRKKRVLPKALLIRNTELSFSSVTSP